jgi:hypothetical protein
MKKGFVGVSDLVGWAVQLEVNYTLTHATLTEAKETHARVCVCVLDILKEAGVVMAVPPDL